MKKLIFPLIALGLMVLPLESAKAQSSNTNPNNNEVIQSGPVVILPEDNQDRLPDENTVDAHRWPITVYPKPSRSLVVNIDYHYEPAEKVRIVIYNMNGQVVYTVEDRPSNLRRVGVENAPPGMYIMKLEMQGKVYTERLMVKR